MSKQLTQDDPESYESTPEQTENTEETGGGESAYVSEEKPKISRNALTFFGIMLAAGGAIAFMAMKGGPQSANAAVTGPAQSTNNAIAAFLNGGSSNIQAMQQMLRNTEKVVRQFMNYPSANQVPLADLKSNPFRQSAARQAPADADVMRKRREAERGEALKAVQGLQLQSIVYSDTRRVCMINNALLREGQIVGVFTVDKITASTVVVRTNDYRFELKMQR